MANPGRSAAGTRRDVTNITWFLPGIALSLIVGVLLARFVARRLGSSPILAGALVVSAGVILAATVTPISESETPLGAARTCDLSETRLISLAELATLDDRSLNVILFVPLGVIIGFLPTTRGRWPIIAAAVLLPFAIESFQLVAPGLNRGCEGSDVVDNLTGLGLGFIAGLGMKRIA